MVVKSFTRVSVTPCVLRCVYCMAEEMTFLPKAELLTIEELEVVSPFHGFGNQKDKVNRRRAFSKEEYNTVNQKSWF